MKYHKSNAELFAEARRALLGRLGTAVWSMLLFTALMLFLSQFSSYFGVKNVYVSLILNLVSRFVATLLISLFGVGLSSIFLKLLYDQPASPRGLITGFLENADNCIRVRFYITFGEFVCLMPLQIFLSLVPSQSLTMMHGNRIRLLRLYIRLLPLHLLGLFSFGIANIWTACCQYASVTAFYKDMMSDVEAR